jgi:uncharacterized membrane protein
MILALAVFFLSHRLPASPPVRRWLTALLGGAGYIALYSLFSLAILGWLIAAAGRAPYVEIWSFAPWQLWAPNIIMPFVCLLIAFGLAAPNPFSIAGRKGEAFDPERPGVAGVTRHPLIWGITLWALAHLIPNGDLAHVILFGLFAAFGFIGMVAIDTRRQREWGLEVWAARARHTSFTPLVGILAGKARIDGFDSPWLRIGAGAALYFALLFSHSAVIGVSPFPA